MINCPNANSKNYIFKLLHENAILLQQDEQTLLNKIFGEYYKQLKTEQLSNQDRVMEPYFEEAIRKLINLGEKLKVIIND